MHGGFLGKPCKKSPKADCGLEIEIAIRDRAPFWAPQIADTEIDRMKLNFAPAEEDELRERSRTIGTKTERHAPRWSP